MIKKILILTVLYLGVISAQITNIEHPKEKVVTNISYPTIKSDINSILSNKLLNGAKYSVAVYSTMAKKWIYTNNYKTLLTPASNTKLFTTFSSFTQLGKDYHIPTSVYTDGNISNGVLSGNIYLVGGGDPLLNINDIEIIADGIKKLGVTKITGNIYGDCSYFDNITDRFQYSNDDSEVQAVAPITALAIEKNTVTIIVTSGSTPGKQVNVQCNPPSSAFTTSVSAVVSGMGKKNLKTSSNDDDINKVKYTENEDYLLCAGDSKSILAANKVKKTKNKNNNNRKQSKTVSKQSQGIQISTNMNSDGKQQFIVKGSLPINRTFAYKYYIKNPALVAAGALKDRLISGGVIVTGNIANQEIANIDSSKKTLLYTFFRDINEVIKPTNKFSDNYLAESLFKLNGAYIGYDKNCAKSASILTQKILSNLDIPCDGIMLNDGSGLSRRNLVTTEALVDLLSFSYKMPFAKNMESSLSIAGIDGTLGKRMHNTLAYNNLRAKTGTLRNVSSLAGYVNTKSGDTLIFACIFNGENVGYYKSIENKIGELLASY